jgi:hypothetical protein
MPVPEVPALWITIRCSDSRPLVTRSAEVIAARVTVPCMSSLKEQI